MTQRPTLGFVGAGKVGHTLARLWYRQGYQVRAVHSRNGENAQFLAALVGAEYVRTAVEVVRAADLTLFTVPDGAITAVASNIAEGWQAMDVAQGKGIVHTSGALDVTALAPLGEKGFYIGSLHPVFPFADVDAAVTGLPGATFGIETESEVLLQWLQGMVDAIKGNILYVPPGGKAAYHAAFVFASNYVVTLYAVAERLLTGLGASREAADWAIDSLLAGTVGNLRQQGIPRALTGPLVRGDIQTIETHLRALGEIDNSLVETYVQLARLSLPMLAARNIDTTFIESILSRENHATDHP
jgi:predicted short-subunit dehydrogenase-like oxidoreductase (DUF2520 family)